MFSYLSSAGNKIIEMLQDLSYFERSEMSKINSKYIPGLELQLTSDYLQEYDYDSTISACFNNEIGILYKLKYGEMGARVSCNSKPVAQFSGKLRVFNQVAGFDLTSMCVIDINRHKLDKWNAGVNMIAGNYSIHLQFYNSEYVISTRHRIHPRFVSLTEMSSPYKRGPRLINLTMGFEYELTSRTSLQVMVSDLRPPTFALHYQLSKPHCLVRVYRDACSNRTGVSFAFHPFSLSPS